MQYTLDINSAKTPLDKYWELCVGSCHATTALREDFRRQLAQATHAIGFRYLRFHGIFDDDMSVLTQKQFTGETVVSFTNIDSIFDFLLSIDMKPFVELSYMPTLLKSDDKTVFHYKGNISPPSSQEKWAWLIRIFAEHLIGRYGIGEVRTWFFEVWNEPNLGGPDALFGFWSGSMEDYFALYATTARTLKSIDHRLKVGGPATSNNSWIPEILDFCRTNDVPIDFVSTHHYPTDVTLGYGVEDSKNAFLPPVDLTSKSAVLEFMKQPDAMQKMLDFHANQWRGVDRGVVTDMTKRAHEQAAGLPLYYTEWNSGGGLPSDGPFGASFIAKTVLDGVGLVEGYSYWTFSDIFEESGMPSAEFHGGYGLLTLHGVAKAPYRAFELLHGIGGEMYGDILRDQTVDVYAFSKKECNAVQLLVVNHHSLLHEINEQTVEIRLQGIQQPSRAKATITRIDDTNANAFGKWQELGSPEYVSEEQLYLLHAASVMKSEQQSVAIVGSDVVFSVNVPPMGIALVNVFL